MYAVQKEKKNKINLPPSFSYLTFASSRTLVIWLVRLGLRATHMRLDGFTRRDFVTLAPNPWVGSFRCHSQEQLVHPTQHQQSIAHARRRTPKQQPQGVRGLHATVSMGFPFSPARELLATVSVIGASPICHRGDDDHLLGPPEADPDPRGAALS